jgi:hypothetical protein
MALAASTIVHTSLAAEPTVLERNEARMLADEGFALFTKGDYATALDRFEQAEARVKAPTVILQRARTLERLGRWLEAEKAFREAAEWTLLPRSPFQFLTAKSDAKRELAALEPRIPKLTVRVLPPGSAPTITVDGRTAPTALTEPLRLDPGDHLVVARDTSGRSAEHQVTLLPAASMTIDVTLEAPSNAPEGAPREDALSTLQLAGWIAVGVGGAATIAGIGVGVGAAAKRGELVDRCPNDACPSSLQAEVDSLDGLRYGSTTTIVLGLALGAGGAAAVLFGGDASEASTPTARRWPSVEPLIGLGSVGARVRF